MTGRNTESMVLVVRAKNLAKSQLVSVGKDLDNVGARATGAQGKAIAFGRFAGAALVGIGAAAAGMAVVSIKAFADFEDRLNQAFAIMGDVAPEVRDSMSEAARAIGRTTRIGAGEAADAFYYLASAGYDAAQSIEAVPQLAAFAQAGMMDMARATDMAADAQSSLGLKVKDPIQNLENLARVTDVLTKGNIIANASIEDMSLALTNKAGAALRLVNKDVEEGVAVLAAFADQGIKAEEGGTALGIVMRDLQTASIKNKDAWDALGVSTFDQTGKMHNMADIVGQMEGLLAGMSDEQKKVTLAQLGFNDKSVAFLQTLLGTSDKIREYEAELRAAGGTTQEVADKQMETLNAQFEVLGGRAKDMAIGLGEDLAPSIKDDLMPALNLAIDSTGEFMEAIGPVLVTTIKFAADAMVSMQVVVLDFIGIWDDEARRKSQQIILNKELAEGLGETMDPAKRLATAMLTLAQQNAWTEDGLRSLIATTGASTYEVAEASKIVLEHAQAAGYDAEYIDMLKAATKDATIATLEHEDAAKFARFATEEQTDANEVAAEGWDDITGEMEEALTAQQAWTDAVKAVTDPVFNAVRSLGDLEEAQVKVNELAKEGKTGTKEWEVAMLDLAEQTIGTQDALDDLSPDQLEVAIGEIANALSITDQEAQDFLTSLGLLDGKDITVKLHVEAPLLRYTPTSNNNYIPQVTGFHTFAEGGNFYRGEPMLVGEQGFEWLVMGTYGTVVSNPDTPGGNFQEWMEEMIRSRAPVSPASQDSEGQPFQQIGQVIFQGTPQQMLADYRHETKLAMRGI